jgi:hypothetical protein
VTTAKSRARDAREQASAPGHGRRRRARQARGVRDVAFHEAAHIAVGHHFGRKILGEACVDPKTLDGASDVDPIVRRPDKATPAIARENLLIAMAGAAAECRRRGRLSHWCDGTDLDRESADAYRRFGLDPSDFREIDALLAYPDLWATVERLAGALQRRSRLSAAEIATVLARCEEEASEDRLRWRSGASSDGC